MTPATSFTGESLKDTLGPSLHTYWIMARSGEKLHEYFSLCIIYRDKLGFPLSAEIARCHKNDKMC